MKVRILAAAILSLAVVVDSAYAQVQNYTVTVQAQDMATIMNALSAMPYKDVYGIIARLSQQINTQTEPKTEPQK